MRGGRPGRPHPNLIVEGRIVDSKAGEGVFR